MKSVHDNSPSERSSRGIDFLMIGLLATVAVMFRSELTASPSLRIDAGDLTEISSVGWKSHALVIVPSACALAICLFTFQSTARFGHFLAAVAAPYIALATLGGLAGASRFNASTTSVLLALSPAIIASIVFLTSVSMWRRSSRRNVPQGALP